MGTVMIRVQSSTLADLIEATREVLSREGTVERIAIPKSQLLRTGQVTHSPRRFGDASGKLPYNRLLGG